MEASGFGFVDLFNRSPRHRYRHRPLGCATSTRTNFTDYEQVPQHEVAVVLGTSKYIGKVLNTYYTHRINAAIELYKQGKVKQFLLSGDNAHRSYNEPWTMKRDLLKAGVPEEVIHLDYAGFRTLIRLFEQRRFLPLSAS